MSQWDMMRKVINGVRTGHVMTDEAILEISAILGVVPTGGLLARHSDISDKPELPVNTDEPYKDYELRSRARSGISDEEANRRASAFADRLSRGDKLRMARIVPEAVKSDHADKMAHLWSLYVNWKKFWFDVDTVTMEDFATYMMRNHQYNIWRKS